jgi:hypothetical protein
MATPQLSPGVLVREVDLTVGRADNVLENVGAIAGPFALGPVNEIVNITTEQELINTFGKPLSTDSQYEYWMSASSYLSYGGVLKVIRTDSANLNCANAGVNTVSNASTKIKNYDDYVANWSSTNSTYIFAAKNPGTWGNGLKVCMIDDLADQIVAINTSNPGNVGAIVGYGMTYAITNTVLAGIGTTTPFTGYLKAIVTGVTTDTQTSNSLVSVKIVSRVSSGGTEYPVSYAEGFVGAAFSSYSSNVNFINNSGTLAGTVTLGIASDWYGQQTLGLTNTTIYWKSIAPKPISNSFTLNRSGKNDGLHVVVVDDRGSITGVTGNILEKHLFLSKSADSVSTRNSPQRNYWKDYLALSSDYLYAGDNPSVGADTYWNTQYRATGFSTAFNPYSESQGAWNQNAQGVTFSALGNLTYTLSGGKDYYGTDNVSNGMVAKLGDLYTSYDLFASKENSKVDFLIMGPGLDNKSESQAKANHLIAIADGRKDCVAVISPHRSDLVNVTNAETQTNNVIQFFSPLSSSSYAVFDSGYKYTYDRFNNLFRYIPCNADIAGLMCRTGIQAYPWFSPAGQQRGILNNAIKLAYNPNQAQRDRLYPLRINSVINQPGIGILLFGDKTALGYDSAFDRINVRRLFLTVEQALQKSAQAQLFELNDQITRANFVNIVEPYLRDVQAKRGLYDFRVICDETNNTPDIIDNNEFRADIYLKPAKSINYVTITFVATRTGVSFEEVAGRV